MARFKIAAIPLAGILLLAILAGTVAAADPTPTPRAQHNGGQMEPGMHFGFLSDAVLQLLGMTRDQVNTELKAGKSLAEIAQAKGVAEQTLIDTIVAAQKAAIAKLVTDGKLTQAKADTLLVNLSDRVKKMVERKFQPRTGQPGGDRAFGLRPNVLSDAVLQLLGMTRDQVRAERQAGKSLVQIAQAKNITEQQLVDTILAPVKTALAQQVADGKLTQAEADTKLANLTQIVTKMVESTATGGFSRGDSEHNGQRAGSMQHGQRKQLPVDQTNTMQFQMKSGGGRKVG